MVMASELNEADTLVLKEDITYNKRLIISNVLQHERFGHIKFSMNSNSMKLIS